jgi:phosphotransferase system enzyme I (PtsI)
LPTARKASACSARNFCSSTATACRPRRSNTKVYREVAAALKPHPVIIRTLDLGGDKFASHLQLAQEMNPFLGWRAIRFCLAQPELFRAQLRAILRASAEGNVKMMYPMISGLDELNQANASSKNARPSCARKKPFDENMEIGAMIEIPSAALDCRRAGAAGEIFQHRQQRFDPIHPGRRPHERKGLAPLRADAPGHPAADQNDRGRRARQRHLGRRLRRNCRRPRAAPLLLGLGVDELSTAPAGRPAGEVHHPPAQIERGPGAGRNSRCNANRRRKFTARCQELARASAPSLT